MNELAHDAFRDSGMAKGLARRLADLSPKQPLASESIRGRMRSALGAARMGNPKSVARAVARIRKEFGSALLRVNVCEAGKGEVARPLTVMLHMWGVEGDTIEYSLLSITPRREHYDFSGGRLLTMTRHALARLIERGGVRSREEIADAMTSLASSVANLFAEEGAVTVPVGARLPLMPVISGGRQEEAVLPIFDTGTRTVVTFLDVEKLGERRKAWMWRMMNSDDALGPHLLEGARVFSETRIGDCDD